MNGYEIRRLVSQAGETVTDDAGNVVGYIRAPARFKVNRDYLAGGGFLVVERDEDTGVFIGIEFDALWDPKRQRHYPAGYSERVFTAPDLDTAVQRVQGYLAAAEPPDPGGV